MNNTKNLHIIHFGTKEDDYQAIKIKRKEYLSLCLCNIMNEKLRKGPLKNLRIQTISNTINLSRINTEERKIEYFIIEKQVSMMNETIHQDSVTPRKITELPPRLDKKIKEINFSILFICNEDLIIQNKMYSRGIHEMKTCKCENRKYNYEHIIRIKYNYMDNVKILPQILTEKETNSDKWQGEH